jgi:hypothetical protein
MVRLVLHHVAIKKVRRTDEFRREAAVRVLIDLVRRADLHGKFNVSLIVRSPAQSMAMYGGKFKNACVAGMPSPLYPA